MGDAMLRGAARYEDEHIQERIQEMATTKATEKPGWKTTEFWFTVLSYILAGLVTFGYLSPEQSGDITGAAHQLVTAVVELVKVLLPLVSTAVYIWSRTKIKTGG